MERDTACTVHVCEEGHCTSVLKYQAGSVESRMVPWTVECTSGSLGIQCNALHSQASSGITVCLTTPVRSDKLN